MQIHPFAIVDRVAVVVHFGNGPVDVGLWFWVSAVADVSDLVPNLQCAIVVGAYQYVRTACYSA
jgi:hypothetical protein